MTATAISTSTVSRKLASGSSTWWNQNNIRRSSKLAQETRLTRESVWFNGQPVAQIETATSTIHYYFNDHLGTPILTTNSTGAVNWQIEREPYGRIAATRAGTGRYQPLAFPGQEDDSSTDRSYNIFRWYRSSWGRYSQSDPLGLKGGIALYGYADADPLGESDPFGLFAQLLCRQVTMNGLPMWKKAIVNTYKPVHCRLRVKCGCGTGPDAFDTTVGREWKDPVYKLTSEPYSNQAFSPSAWTSYPVDGTGPNCEFEKCVLKAFQAQQGHPGLVPTYNPTGPNSNTFVHDLIKQCGGSAAAPPKAKGFNWPD